MAYIDGFIVPVPKANLTRYREWALLAEKIWKEYGALDYKEWVGDDVKPGKVTSFPQSVNLKDDEVVVFAWAVYESRQQRDEIIEKIIRIRACRRTRKTGRSMASAWSSVVLRRW